MASITGIYYGLTEPVLLKMRTDALAQLALARQGKRFASVSGGGKSFAKQNMTMAELTIDIQEINGALRKLNPDAYGRRVRSIYPDFSTTPSGGV
jgi:hypothetical protein